MQSGRVGRDYHSRRDNVQQQHHHPRHQNHHSSSSSRFEESKSGRGKNPPSRHLWVGNLSNHIDQSTLTDEFIRFGDLENIAYHPGRSYAFVNFIREDDAIAALNSLQGFSLGGMPLRIEFAKSVSFFFCLPFIVFVIILVILCQHLYVTHCAYVLVLELNMMIVWNFASSESLVHLRFEMIMKVTCSSPRN